MILAPLRHKVRHDRPIIPSDLLEIIAVVLIHIKRLNIHGGRVVWILPLRGLTCLIPWSSITGDAALCYAHYKLLYDWGGSVPRALPSVINVLFCTKKQEGLELCTILFIRSFSLQYPKLFHIMWPFNSILWVILVAIWSFQWVHSKLKQALHSYWLSILHHPRDDAQCAIFYF